MNTGSNNKALATNKGRSAFLFLLALLMLVVSCPFKRLLQADNNTRVAAHPSPRTNGIDRQTAAYETKSCCVQKQKITLVNADGKDQNVKAPEFISTQDGQTGFALHYFLNGTEKQFSPVGPTNLSSFPLFLQYRRLLI